MIAHRHTVRSVTAATALVAVSALVLASCGGGSDGSSTAGAEVLTGDVEVVALDNTFVPETVTVAAGATVTWVNRGRNDHNVIPVDEAPFRVEVADFGPRAEASFTLDAPGTYRYYCTLHATPDRGMIGTIEVVEP